MSLSAGRAHIAAAFRWSREVEIGAAEILAAGLGMAAPLALAAGLGDLPAGLAAATGALLATGPAPLASPASDGVGTRLATSRSPFGALVLIPTILALAAATLLAGHGWRSDAGMAFLAGMAALAGGYNRASAIATTRFILSLIIATAVVGEIPDRGAFLVLMIAGVLWTAGLRRALHFALRTKSNRDRLWPAWRVETARVTATAAQRFARWKKSLARRAGWHYCLRLTLCLAIAGWLRWFWPGHHLYWIALTVALLLTRRIEVLPVRTTQRVLGTALGLIGAAAFLNHPPPDSILILGIGLLAAARPGLRRRNYLAYSAIMTPLLVLILDAGQKPEAGILRDRLIATLIGAALVVAANLAVRLLLPAQAPPKPLSSPPRSGAG